MSYSDDVDLEAQIPYTDSPEFDRIAESISSQLFDVNSNIVTLQRLLKTIAKRTNDIPSEERAVEVAEDSRQKFRELGDLVKRLQEWEDVLPAQRFTQQKLSREFGSALSEFQGIQRDLAERQRSSIIRAKSSIASGTLIDNQPSESLDENDQSQLLAQDSLDRQAVEYQQSLIQEREAEIQGIEQGIEELNEIFTDLGTIVTEQGTIVDNIESNIFNVAQSTRQAASELTKAARYQRNSRGRAFCLLIILVIILTVILLGIFVG